MRFSFKKSSSLIKKIIFLSVLSYSIASSASYAKDKKRSQKVNSTISFNSAKKAFAKNNFPFAISILRKLIDRYPANHDAYTLLGASYYYTGEPEKALKVLRQVALKSRSKDANFYFQGLSYQAIKDDRKAILAFEYAAQFSGKYGERSAIEASFELYHQNRYSRAKYWSDAYAQKFPNGKFIKQAKTISTLSAKKEYQPDIEGPKRIDPNTMLFRYSPDSLAKRPNYWYMASGYQQSMTTQQEPKTDTGLKTVSGLSFAMLLEAGAGIGPLNQGRSTSIFGGYNYRQRWLTGYERLLEFFESFDPLYFIFRADLLERSHEFYGTYTRRLSEKVYFDLLFSKEITKLGSQLIPHPDSEELQIVLDTRDRTTIKPSITYRIDKHSRVKGYFLFNRTIELDNPTLSNQSYLLESEDSLNKFSIGLNYQKHLPNKKVYFRASLYNFNLYFNDPYVDHQRTGVAAEVDYQYTTKISFQPYLLYSTDTYVQQQPKRSSCGSSSETSDTFKSCPRIDTNTVIGVKGTYRYSRTRYIDGYIFQQNNGNPTLKEFDKSNFEFQVMFTYGFPNGRDSKRTANSGRLKQQEQSQR